MKTKWLHTLALGVVLVLSGCATQKIDWAGRIGNYTYDQALVEFGPPDKLAQTSDGRTIAEWLTARGSPGGYYPDHFYHHGYHPYYFHSIPLYDPPTPDRFVRLTFDGEGILTDWRRVMK